MPGNPHNDINARVYRQIDRVLDDLENPELPIGPKDRVAALYTIGRLQVIFNTLRKGGLDDRSGSSVRRYATAFAKTDGRGRRAAIARPAAPDGLGDDEADDDIDAA